MPTRGMDLIQELTRSRAPNLVIASGLEALSASFYWDLTTWEENRYWLWLRWRTATGSGFLKLSAVERGPTVGSV